MVKFKVLANNQRLMSSILRIDVEQKHKSDDSPFLLTSVAVILFILFSALASCAVRLNNSSYDFAVRSIAALALISMCQAIIICLSMSVHLEKTKALYSTLQAIVDANGWCNLFYAVLI